MVDCTVCCPLPHLPCASVPTQGMDIPKRMQVGRAVEFMHMSAVPSHLRFVNLRGGNAKTYT